MTKIKICGLTRKEDIDYVNALRPDYIGLVFAKWSKRAVTPAQAARLKALLDPAIQVVGVFVDEDFEQIRMLAENHIIDLVQLHGREDTAYVDRLKQTIDKPIIQAFPIETELDLVRANASLADLVLLDHGKGGSGQRFDWSLTRGMNRPFMLAGGLSPQNVGRAIEACRPYAVDASSGVETDGVKDYDKIKALIDTVRAPRTMRS